MVAVCTSPELSLANAVASVEAGTPGVVPLDVAGLSANTTYYYGVIGVDGPTALESSRAQSQLTPDVARVVGHLRSWETGSFTTLAAAAGQPLDFRVAFASCADTGANTPVFTDIARLQPRADLFVHMGDLHYEDIAVDSDEAYMQAYETVFGSAGQAALWARTPIAYTWDDHDFGPDNSDRNAPGKAAAQRTYRSVVPHYPLVSSPSAASGPIYHAFTVGRVRFIMTDLRSAANANASPPTTLGTAQRAWFLSELANHSQYAMLVWVSSKPWMGPETDGGDAWPRFHEERRDVANAIRDLGVDNLVMLTGDAHMAAIDDGSHTDFSDGADGSGEHGGAGFPLFHAAPLKRFGSAKTTGPFSHGCYGYKWFVTGQFGTMDVRDSGGEGDPVCFTWRIHRERASAPLAEFEACAPFVTVGVPGDGGCELPLLPAEDYAIMVALLVLQVVLVAACCWLCASARLCPCCTARCKRPKRDGTHGRSTCCMRALCGSCGRRTTTAAGVPTIPIVSVG